MSIVHYKYYPLLHLKCKQQCAVRFDSTDATSTVTVLVRNEELTLAVALDVGQCPYEAGDESRFAIDKFHRIVFGEGVVAL